MAENKIKRLDNPIRDHNTRAFKPILIIILVLLLFSIIALILFKDKFKLGSINSFDESTTLLYNKKLESIYDEINIDVEFANIYIKPTNNDYIEIFMYGDSAKTNVSKDGKSLNVNLKLTCTICHDVPSGKIVITVPDNEISNININSHYGDITIGDMPLASVVAKTEYGDFNASSLDVGNVELVSGNIKINSINSITAKCEMGNITIGYVNVYAGLQTNIGNVIVSDLNVKKESYITSETGSISLINEYDLFYACKSNKGKIYKPDNINTKKTKVKLTTDTGNITVGAY